MKVLLLNGSPHEKGCTYTALSEVAAALTADGVEAEILWACLLYTSPALRRRRKVCRGNCPPWATRLFAVSYTHLDVYKRQP